MIDEVGEKAYGLTPLSGYKYCKSHKAGQCLKTKVAQKNIINGVTSERK